jgi:membrane-associated phospholipid phosphatase
MVLVFPNGQPQVAVDFEASILRWIAGLRADWLTPTMRVLSAVGTGWTATVLGWGTVVLLLVFKRWRHLFTFLIALVVLFNVMSLIYIRVARPRPYDVEIIGSWTGFAMPSYPIAVLTAGLIGIAYSLVVAGRPRQWAKWGIVVIVAVVAFARLYMGVDHPADIVQGVVLTVAFMLIAFRWFAPNEAFPVTYRRGKTAHLDVTGARGDAIRQAINHQLGLTV